MQKRYDQAYFDRWYRGRTKIGPEPEVRRKVAMAVGVTEYLLRRGIRNAIDIGCGEAPWFTHLVAVRPNVRYAGYDPSDYVVRTFGAARNIRRGSFGELAELNIRERFDLVICADVLHYLGDDEIRDGLPQLVRLTRGAAFLEVLTREDEVVGDTTGMYRRSADWYRDVFRRAKLRQVAPFLWAPPKIVEDAAALEL
ncbi:MAG TPA: class I SAM-dependent methyltransferase [Candidatus Tumulicola sp.]|nr:class I SAM-dependent methyltransferase [Candidatus Tumulicola sp.]